MEILYRLWRSPSLFALLIILITSRNSRAFPKRSAGPIRHSVDASGRSLAFYNSNLQRTRAHRQIRHNQSAPCNHHLLNCISSVQQYEVLTKRKSIDDKVSNKAWTVASDRFSVLSTRGGILQKPRQHRERLPLVSNPRTIIPAATKNSVVNDRVGTLDAAIFAMYFSNIFVLMLSVVTVPAIAIEHNLSPHATAAFCASMASLAPLGGFMGKLVNGFVCQHLGGHVSSVVYLLALSALSLGMSFSKSLAPVGLFILGFDFLSSIQWVSASSILNQHYRHNPKLKARGIALLSIASTLGALSSKTIGTLLLRATEWRTVCQFGALAAFVGATAIFFGGAVKPSKDQSMRSSALGAAATRGGQTRLSPLASLRTVLGSPIFWMTSLGHSLGHLSRVSDRVLAPFLQEVGGISSSVAVGLTSFVTIGFILGLYQGSVFNKMKSVTRKMTLIKRSYVIAITSTLGLAACGIKGVTKLVGGNANIIVAAIAIFSGLIATSVSFQFYQIPNLVTSTVFPESSSVALSLTDAVAFLVTAGIMGVNKVILGNLGWSASWLFMAVFFSFGGVSMTRAVRPVLIEMTKKIR